jgi:hypothetical protein
MTIFIFGCHEKIFAGVLKSVVLSNWNALGEVVGWGYV